MTVAEMAKELNISKQCVYQNMRKGRFPNCYLQDTGNKKEIWYIPTSDIDGYKNKKYVRVGYYKREKGELPVREFAGMCGITVQQVYRLCKAKKIRYRRRSWHYVILKESVGLLMGPDFRLLPPVAPL